MFLADKMVAGFVLAYVLYIIQIDPTQSERASSWSLHVAGDGFRVTMVLKYYVACKNQDCVP